MTRLLVAAAALALAAVLPAPAAPPSPHGAGSGPPAPATGLPLPAVTLTATPVPLPGGEGGIGFDDLLFVPELGRIVVPAGRTGNLDLVDPATREVTAIGGFSAVSPAAEGHGAGTTSADYGRGLLFATDRTARKLVVVDPAAKKIVAKADLAGSPDYVRWVAPTGEIWVTEPDGERIEIFSLPKSGPPVPRHAAFLPVPGGPESLVVDAGRGRAYANLWEKQSTLAIDVRARSVALPLRNPCAGARGLALDARRNLLFIGCAEGRAAALDLARGGALAGVFGRGSGVDIIAYSPALGHLYLPGSKSSTLAVIGVSAKGALGLLAVGVTARGAHCAAADDRGGVWVCDPERGRLLRFEDKLPASGAG